MLRTVVAAAAQACSIVRTSCPSSVGKAPSSSTTARLGAPAERWSPSSNPGPASLWLRARRRACTSRMIAGIAGSASSPRAAAPSPAPIAPSSPSAAAARWLQNAAGVRCSTICAAAGAATATRDSPAKRVRREAALPSNARQRRASRPEENGGGPLSYHRCPGPRTTTVCHRSSRA